MVVISDHHDRNNGILCTFDKTSTTCSETELTGILPGQVTILNHSANETANRIVEFIIRDSTELFLQVHRTETRVCVDIVVNSVTTLGGKVHNDLHLVMKLHLTASIIIYEISR